jgi:hypothetical protein
LHGFSGKLQWELPVVRPAPGSSWTRCERRSPLALATRALSFAGALLGVLPGVE